MTAAALLERAAELGISLWIEPPDGLRVRWPAAPDPQLRAGLIERKTEILAILRERSRPTLQPCLGCGRFHFVEPTLCFWCRRPTPAPARPSGSARPRGIDWSSRRGQPGACGSCGGGLGPEDGDFGPCSSCRRLRGQVGR